MSKKILGIGNAIVDVFVKVDDNFLSKNNLTKGSMKLLEKQEFESLKSTIKIEKIEAGGSVANTMAGIAYLGGHPSFIGKINSDEFGKIYNRSEKDKFQELERCCLVITGQKNESSWKQTATAADFYTLKGAVDALIKGLGLKITSQEMEATETLSFGITWSDTKQTVGFGGEVSPKWLEKMDGYL